MTTFVFAASSSNTVSVTTIADVWSALTRSYERGERDIRFAFGEQDYSAIDELYVNDARECRGVLLLRDDWSVLRSRGSNLVVIAKQLLRESKFLIAILTLACKFDTPEDRAVYSRIYATVLAAEINGTSDSTSIECEDDDTYYCDDPAAAANDSNEEEVDDRNADVCINSFSENRVLSGKACRDNVSLLAASYENFYRDFFHVIKYLVICNPADFYVSRKIKKVDIAALFSSS